MASIATTDFRKHQNPCSRASSRFPERSNHSRDGFAKVGYERVRGARTWEMAARRQGKRPKHTMVIYGKASVSGDLLAVLLA